MVLFSGSGLCGGDVLAAAMHNDVAKKYIIVGGAGHTTDTLRSKIREEFPQINTEGLSEAEIFSLYLKFRYNLQPDLFFKIRLSPLKCDILMGLKILDEDFHVFIIKI